MKKLARTLLRWWCVRNVPMRSDGCLPRLEPPAATVHGIALRQIDLPLVGEFLGVGLGLIEALALGDCGLQPAAAAARGIPVPRPLPIDVGELANPPLVALADAQRACRLRAKLKAPPWVVAEAHHVGHLRRLRRRGGLLLSGGCGAIRPERTVFFGVGRPGGPHQTTAQRA